MTSATIRQRHFRIGAEALASTAVSETLIARCCGLRERSTAGYDSRQVSLHRSRTADHPSTVSAELGPSIPSFQQRIPSVTRSAAINGR